MNEMTKEAHSIDRYSNKKETDSAEKTGITEKEAEKRNAKEREKELKKQARLEEKERIKAKIEKKKAEKQMRKEDKSTVFKTLKKINIFNTCIDCANDKAI